MVPILGIDPSVSKTGLAAITDGGFRWDFLDMRKTKQHPALSDPGRLEALCSLVLMAMDDWFGGDEPEVLVCIEDCIATQGPARLNIALHWMLRTVIATVYEPTVLVVAPTSLKKFVTGSGNAEKGTIGAQVEKRWGGLLSGDPPEDVLEAFALAKLAECWQSKGEGDWTEFQRDVALTQRIVKKVALPREAVYDGESIRQAAQFKERLGLT